MLRPLGLAIRTLVFAVLMVSGSLAQSVSAQKSPQETQKPATEADHSDEPYIIEKLYASYHFEADGTGTRKITTRVKIQSESGIQAWGQLIAGYNSANERLNINYVRVLKADGSTITAPESSVQDLNIPIEKEAPVYTDYRQKHVTVPGLRPGDVLEYEMEAVVHTALAPNQFWVEHEFTSNAIVLDEQLEINIPASCHPKLKTKEGFDPKITETGGRRVYLWKTSKLERDEPKTGKKPKVQPKRQLRTQEKERPAIQMTTFTSWEQVGQWYAGLEKERREPTPEINTQAASLIAGKTTDLEKIETIYRFVAANFRYISLSFGVGRFQPHPAVEVLQNQYGDCKDKNVLLASLLEAAGYHSSSVLINSVRKLDPDVPSPSQFDHVISVVPLGTEEIWMDTTTEVAPFRLLFANLRKKQALVIPQAGGLPHLEETPANPPTPSVNEADLEGVISDAGKLDATVHIVERGDVELIVRMVFRRVPTTQWNEVVKGMSTQWGLDGDITDLHVGDPADTSKPFELSYKFTESGFLDWSKKKIDLSLPFSNNELPDLGSEDENQLDPIKLGAPGTNSNHIKLTVPEKYSVRLPVSFSMSRDFGEYRATYHLEKNLFSAERQFVLRQGEIPVTKTEEYESLRRALNADLAQKLTLESTIEGKPPTPEMTADELNHDGFEAYRNANFPLAQELLSKAVEKDPKHKSAWNNLGNLYLAERRPDDAIVAFKKQIEINAYDQYAYNNLGRAYWVKHQYEDAAVAFKKQLEIEPLDKFAHRNLGGMYLEWKKYDEAAAELESATSLQPEDSDLQVRLGTAYLNLDKDEKAVSAFNKAVELSASPLVWNNVAYELSEKGKHLELAEQYAQSAIMSTAAALRNASLNQLNQRDLGLVSSLSAYWDTLGWVYFKEGNLEKAGKYVLSSWTLSQHPAVGDHLGQLYEKAGRKDDATRVYAMALAGWRPSPEVKTHLAALVGEDQVPTVTAKFKDNLQQARTIKIGKAKESGTAEFFVALANNGSEPTVEGVKFISGEEKMKPYEEILRAAKYDFAFPDDTPTKILRRGVLSCPTTGTECLFVLMLPEDVRSVN